MVRTPAAEDRGRAGWLLIGCASFRAARRSQDTVRCPMGEPHAGSARAAVALVDTAACIIDLEQWPRASHGLPGLRRGRRGRDAAGRRAMATPAKNTHVGPQTTCSGEIRSFGIFSESFLWEPGATNTRHESSNPAEGPRNKNTGGKHVVFEDGRVACRPLTMLVSPCDIRE